MENGRNLLRRIAPVVIVVIVVWGLASLFDSSPATGEIRRPDVIRIQTVARLKPLEMPPAVFLHDAHTQKLLTEGKDCTLCHETGAPFSFMAVAEAKKAKGMELAFHEGCLGCHKKMAAGPRDGECRLCHTEQLAVRDAEPVSMGDRSLHYLHVSSSAITYTGDVPNPDGLNCGVCHHVYDEETKALVWKPGAEDACAACHKAEAQGSTPSLQQASHTACVSCHVKAGQEKASDDAASAKENARDAEVRRIVATPDMMTPRPAVWSPDGGPAFVLASMRLAPGQIAAPDMERPQASQLKPVAPVAPECAPAPAPAAKQPAAVENAVTPPVAPLVPKTPTPVPENGSAPATPESVDEATEPGVTNQGVQETDRVEALLRALLQESAEREDARQKRAASEAAAIEAEIVTGPITCAGCHTAEAQAAWRKVSDPPRLMRGQPNATILMPAPDSAGKRAVTDAAGMDPVIFNHKAHEEVTDTCRTCHHQRISACTDCHTVAGVQEGDFVTLEQAMHTGCRGCHQQTVMSKVECAGCHGSLNKPLEIKTTCTVCHQPVEGLPTESLSPEDLSAEGVPVDGLLVAGALDKAELDRIAEANLLAHMLNKTLAPDSADIDTVIAEMPESVRIGALENTYEAVTFPHRRIFEALQEGIRDNPLADSFHTSELATCAACHHNIPAETLATPPACASCHGSQADTQETNSNRPSLKAAYHQQCMACHERMNITKPAATDCTGCHAARQAASK